MFIHIKLRSEIKRHTIGIRIISILAEIEKIVKPGLQNPRVFLLK